MSEKQRYSHAIPIEHNLPSGPLWEYKHNKSELEILKRTNPHVYAGQYDQNPSPKGGGIFQTDWWRYYQIQPVFDYRIITADTAQKDKEINDYTVFQLWGAVGNQAYLIDQYRDKIEAPELEIQAIAFWNKHVDKQSGVLRGMYVEDKVSGTSLIQQISRKGKFPIIPVQRHISKVIRYFNVTPAIASGMVFLPQDAEWLFDYKEELRKITPLDTHKHDDQADTMADAVEIICLGAHIENPDEHIEDAMKNTKNDDLNYSIDGSMNDYLEDERGLF